MAQKSVRDSPSVYAIGLEGFAHFGQSAKGDRLFRVMRHRPELFDSRVAAALTQMYVGTRFLSLSC